MDDELSGLDDQPFEIDPDLPDPAELDRPIVAPDHPNEPVLPPDEPVDPHPGEGADGHDADRPPGRPDWPRPHPHPAPETGDGPLAEEDAPNNPSARRTAPDHDADGEPVVLEIDEPTGDGLPVHDQASDESGSVVGLPADVDPRLSDEGPFEESSVPDTDDGDVHLPVQDPALLEPFDVAPGNGALDPGVVAAALGVIGAVSALPAVRRLARPSPPEAVALLDALGIDARVEHGDLGTIEEQLAVGGSVMLAVDGSAGTDVDNVLVVREVDVRGERLVMSDAAGRGRIVALDRFEAAWADSANQLVIGKGQGASVMLLPVALDASAFLRRPGPSVR